MIVPSTYRAPKFYFNGHVETIAPALFRRVGKVGYQRQRINLPDGDFLDLDWLKGSSKKLAIISHGLEGCSYRPYIKGMARAFYQAGYDVIAWNFRGCSGQVNRQERFYHSGATEDLDLVIKHALSMDKYRQVHLVGFSLGGNITLKYLGERGDGICPKIKSAVAFSVPMDLHGCCQQLSKPSNTVYAKRFLRNLIKKIEQKAAAMPGAFSLNGIRKIKTLKEFDNRYTAPIHGFKNAVNYYDTCSSIHFVEDIKVPTLIINAKNDPMLTDSC